MPEFVLVLMVLIPLVLGIAQLALVLHVRNTMVAAASDGARAAAGLGSAPPDGQARAREVIRTTLADRYADDVVARETQIDGVAVVEVRIRAEVPPLGLWGPGVSLDAVGHAVRQEEP
ncbi:TadE/TadG family type IV pilus assembly protein [Aeromicrobium duanguangcaii]|uniref:Pilus assembly protein n=1 Tax=Aeromicrobium duanguangcaii TaxID=2968086 RepID=A0ABY5KFY1_9ACTN|nr:TadE/TadG family type IV pilus assembly protein [Aeromicrobium duanguangcaii]MCD9154625.1 pilus assembly protein [Aeromicrobium duanguangcaii]UUI67960.1 pilus assembly protein [Aeromicrobium duanguangcaii]